MTPRPVILIVDDEPANISIMAAALQDDYEICFANNGADVIRLAGRARPELILLDVMMPGQDGYDVCTGLKADPQLCDIPVIFTTSLGAAEDELRGLSVGAIDYMTKPINPQLLHRRVENHVALKHLRDQLTRQALTDPLTGLSNRRMLDSRMPEEIRRLSRDLGWLSFLMIDIDFFKQFNDLYGHPAGDDCLKAVGHSLRAMLNRGGDQVVRYGGEEFACLLPDADPTGARHLAEAMRCGIEDLGIRHDGSRCSDRITISVGIASVRCTPDMTPPLWLSQADHMLYSSKSSGRNRVSAVMIGPPNRS